MKTSQCLLAALAVTLLGTTSLFADHIVCRIDHPNGPPTYVTSPAQSPSFVSSGATIGVYAGERSFAGREQVVRSESGLNDREGRTMVPIHRGRGQTDYSWVQR